MKKMVVAKMNSMIGTSYDFIPKIEGNIYVNVYLTFILALLVVKMLVGV